MDKPEDAVAREKSAPLSILQISILQALTSLNHKEVGASYVDVFNKVGEYYGKGVSKAYFSEQLKKLLKWGLVEKTTGFQNKTQLRLPDDEFKDICKELITVHKRFQGYLLKTRAAFLREELRKTAVKAKALEGD